MTITSSNSGITEKPVWFITGCSTGFGRELAKYVLELGYRTVVTARNPHELKEFEGKKGALILTLDVTDRSQAEAAIKNAEEEFGCIDVLVNNAGIGYFAAVEESEEVQVRKMFEVNFFGLSRMIHVALPSMRKRRKGFIVNISSLAGICGFPGVGYYNATKFAVEGLSEALSQEVEPLGIKVIIVEPSGFRTDWAGRSANESKRQIKDYEATAGVSRNHLRADSGKQPGDPIRAVHAIVKAVESANPPHHLLLGNNAFEAAMAKLEELGKEYAAGEAVARAADFPVEERRKVIDSAVA